MAVSKSIAICVGRRIACPVFGAALWQGLQVATMAKAILLSDVISNIESSNERKKLLLHCCCAPCASHVLKLIAPYFKITTIYCETNIVPESEYTKRENQLRKMLSMEEYRFVKDSVYIEYDRGTYDKISKIPMEKEGGFRCVECFASRLKEVAFWSVVHEQDYFATTLTVSPHKNAQLINIIGSEISKVVSADYLVSDFKKQGGFQRSIEISKRLGLYRQSYCGCKPVNS